MINYDEAGDKLVFMIVGRVQKAHDEAQFSISIFVTAADDDDAVRRALNSLSEEGYVSAELDRIGLIEVLPEEPLLKQAYDDALGGEVVIVTFLQN